MNSVKIYVSRNQSNTNTILLESDVLDLFETETIPYTLKTTDLSELGTSYSSFTKDFIIPASKRNNKTLKYWLDTKNDNQFLSNAPIPARIDISGVFFSLGSIKIINYSTDESGAPKSYTITYTGTLSNLKTQFGDTLVGDLPFSTVLGSDIIPFTDADVVSNITNATTYKPIEIPLISTNRIIPDYTTIEYETGVNNPDGIKRSELRPALKFRTIFEAIEQKYSVTFTGNFITGNTLDKMYLFLNKNESLYTSGGNIIRFTGTPTTTAYIEYRPNLDSDDYSHGYISLIRANTALYGYVMYYDTDTMSDNSIPYRCKIQEVILNNDGTIDEISTREQTNFGIISTSEFVTGTKKPAVQFTLAYQNTNAPIGSKRHFRFVGETENEDQVAIVTNHIYVYTYIGFSSSTKTTFSPPNSTLLKNDVLISSNIPEIKIQDFVTSLIKMYNLVIVPKLNNTYELDFYTNYYATGNTIDITKYCSPLKKANRVKTYKEISFKPDDSDYSANKQYKARQQTVREFGEIKQSYTDGDIESFKVESKFGLILFRELNKIDFTSDFDLTNTWIVGDGSDGNSIVSNKPTVFFYNGKANILDSKYVAYTTDVDVSVSLATYSQFSNIDNLTDYTTTLCFSSESMFNRSYDKSLYLNNYSKLMSSIISPYAREFEIDAVLPKHIFTTLNLNNQLIIGNENFSISEISIDLLTGKSKLKLNNIIQS